MCRAEFESCADTELQLSSPRSHRQFLLLTLVHASVQVPRRSSPPVPGFVLKLYYIGMIESLPTWLTYFYLELYGWSFWCASPQVSCLPCINYQVKGQTSLGVRPNLLLTQAADIFMVCTIGRKKNFFSSLFTLEITEEIPLKTLNTKTVYVSVFPTTADF